LIEISQKLSEANLSRAKAESENVEVHEQNTLMKRLMDKAQIERDKLQKRVASFDGELLVVKDEHRKKMNAVKDQFFADRFKENRAGEEYLRNQYAPHGKAQHGGGVAAQRLAQATMLSTGHNAGGQDLGVEADMHRANKEFHNAPAHAREREYDMSFGRSGTLGQTMGGGANYNAGNPGPGGAGAGERVMKL
jgi:hypothetical protein